MCCSQRVRHTRLQGDWSSDVCSSDLACKLSPSGISLIYGTYVGGGGNDRGSAIAVDGSGAAYLVGETASNNLPTAGDQPRTRSEERRVGREGGTWRRRTT